MSYTAKELMSAIEQAVESVTGRVSRCTYVRIDTANLELGTDKLTAEILMLSGAGLPTRGGEECNT